MFGSWNNILFHYTKVMQTSMLMPCLSRPGKNNKLFNTFCYACLFLPQIMCTRTSMIKMIHSLSGLNLKYDELWPDLSACLRKTLSAQEPASERVKFNSNSNQQHHCWCLLLFIFYNIYNIFLDCNWWWHPDRCFGAGKSWHHVFYFWALLWERKLLNNQAIYLEHY